MLNDDVIYKTATIDVRRIQVNDIADKIEKLHGDKACIDIRNCEKWIIDLNFKQGGSDRDQSQLQLNALNKIRWEPSTR